MSQVRSRSVDLLAIALSFLVAGAFPVHAAVFQWIVSAGGSKARAYVWVPPTATKIQGIILGGKTLAELEIVQDPDIRKVATEANLAIVFMDPGVGLQFSDDKGGRELLGLMADIARETGIAEFEHAPWITIGHSTGGIFCRNVAYWKPGRVIGVVHIKSGNFQEKPGPDVSLGSVPMLTINGEFEEFGPASGYRDGLGNETQWVVVREQLQEMRQKDGLVSLAVDPGAGHFTWSKPLSQLVGVFIRQAVKARVPAGADFAAGPVELKVLDPKGGWLTDPEIKKPAIAAAAYGDYKGDKTRAMWHLNAEMAAAVEDFHRGKFGKADQLVAFVKNGAPVPLQGNGRTELTVVPIEDGLTLKVAAMFLKEYPSVCKNPNAGKPVENAGGAIQFKAIGSPLVANGPDTFRISLNRFYPNAGNMRLHITGFHPGNEKFRYAECTMDGKFSVKTQGKAQVIDFPKVPDLKADAGPVTLAATSDSGLPVNYYVLSGPAEVEANVLRVTDVPVRAKAPIRVTVVAFQMGRISPDPIPPAIAEVSFMVAR